MGIVTSKHKRRIERHKKETRDVVTQVGTIDFVDEELLFTSDRRPPPLFQHMLASSIATDSVAKEMVPVASLSQSMNLNLGDCVTESERCRSTMNSLQRQGDCAWDIRRPGEAEVKWIQPITYQLRMKIIESPITRLLFMELYGLDLRRMDKEEFVRWAKMACLPRTAHMYQTFLYDANNYAIPKNLSKLENRFNVRVTLGDCVPFIDSGAERKKRDITKKQYTRELIFYAEGPYRINSAANYFGATLNQLKADQLLLPNDRTFSLLENTNLLPWIVPRPPDVVEPILVKLRRQALAETSEDATTCSTQY